MGANRAPQGLVAVDSRWAVVYRLPGRRCCPSSTARRGRLHLLPPRRPVVYRMPGRLPFVRRRRGHPHFLLPSAEESEQEWRRSVREWRRQTVGGEVAARREKA